MRYLKVWMFAVMGVMLATNVNCALESGTLLGDEEVDELTSFVVEGTTFYGETALADVYVALVNEEFVLVDETVTDSVGAFWLQTQEPGFYTLLAGQDDEYGRIMAVAEMEIQEQDQVVDLVLEEVTQSDLSGFGDEDMPVFSLNCWTTGGWIWCFCRMCCGSYWNCFWTWCC